MDLDLELDIDNPYAHGQIYELPDGDIGIEGPINMSFRPSKGDRLYAVGQGENFSDISFRGYENSKWWWLLYLANDVDFPFELENLNNFLLKVPDLETLNALEL